MTGDAVEVPCIGGSPDEADRVVPSGFFDGEIDADDSRDESDQFDLLVDVGGEQEDWCSCDEIGDGLGKDADDVRN